MSRINTLLIASGLLVVSVASSALAQGPKRPLTPDDWDQWRSIGSPTIVEFSNV